MILGIPEKEFKRSGIFNPGHNILELYNISFQDRFATSKTKLDI